MAGFCPWYNLECPRNIECEIWDTATDMCGIRRQKSLLELINMKGADSVASAPPIGYYKVVNIFVNPTTGKTVVRYDDTPIE